MALVSTVTVTEGEALVTAVERQRRRRTRLREEGRVEASVAVRADRVDRLRAVAVELDLGHPIGLRLLPALAVVRGLRGDLLKAGVARAGLFGSTARGEDGPGSDLDVVLSLSPSADPDPIDLIKLEDRVREAFSDAFPNVPIDVSVREDMRADVRAAVDAEAVYAF